MMGTWKYHTARLRTQGLLTTESHGGDFQKRTDFCAQIAVTPKQKEIL